MNVHPHLVEQHNREVCPLRIIQCIYCNQEMQANEETPHIGQCRNHPDTEIPCPYKELGCEAIVLRKNMNIHIKENITNHHTLMLYQLNQLRNRNDQLESRIRRETAAEREDENNTLEFEIQQQRRKDMKVARRLVLLALVAVGIGVILAAIIGIAVAASQGNNIKANSEQIAYNSEQINSNSAKIAVNSEQTESNLQLIGSLLSNTSYIYEYIEVRGKVLPGIEERYDLTKTGTFYGPTFYLRQCKLRLRAKINGLHEYAEYYVDRLKGEYDDSIANCRITFTYASFWYMNATQPEYTIPIDLNTELKVGGSQTIGVVYWKNTNRKVVVRVYFDTVGT